MVVIPTIEQGTMKKELELSQNIEDYVLKMIGKNVISWDKIVFIINKILLIFMFMLLFQRGDFLTVSDSYLLKAYDNCFFSRFRIQARKEEPMLQNFTCDSLQYLSGFLLDFLLHKCKNLRSLLNR